MQMYITAFPDLHFRIDQLHASGDHVVTQYTATGTHNGDLMGIPPTRRQAEVHGCTVAEIRNGKVVRSCVYWDTGHLLRQLTVPRFARGTIPLTGVSTPAGTSTLKAEVGATEA
jgi:steroid delta-isomerase-like uncharacterized protein